MKLKYPKAIAPEQAIKKLRPKIMLQYNLGKLPTYRDYLLAIGEHPRTIDYVYSGNGSNGQLAAPLTRPSLLAELDALEWRTLHYQYEYPSASNISKEEFEDSTESTIEILSGDGTKKGSDSDAGKRAIKGEVQKAIIIPSLYRSKEHHPLQKATLINKQEEAAIALFDGIVRDDKHGQLLLAAAGKGKTFILGAVIRRLIDQPDFLYKKSLAPWKICYVTKASIVTQTARVLRNQFGIDTDNECIVINYDQLRATFGEMFIKWESVVQDGDAQLKPKWKPIVYPMIFIFDECQTLKNEDSLQSQIGQAVNEIENNYGTKYPVYQIHASATPFTRVIEAKCFCVSTRIPFSPSGSGAEQPLTNKTWSDFARWVASPSEPDEHCEAAIERLIEQVHPYIVDVKGMRSQYHAQNAVNVIEFQTPEQRKRYDEAWEKHLERKAKIAAERGDDNAGQSRFAEFASFTIFRGEAEDIRAEYISDFLHSCWINGEAGVAACCFKRTITSIVQFLIKKHGYGRDDISLIWGGAAKKQKVKKKKSQAMSAAELEAFLHTASMSGMSEEEATELLDTLEETVEEKINEDLDPALRLGNQTRDDRQREIDRFQAGKTKFCIFTFKSGGVGLSLHHCDELTTYKVKRKASGYYEESDIPNCTEVRPRSTILTPTYSAIEMVQGLGRAPRQTSMSDTKQIIAFYAGTIEERVAATVSQKLKCLKKVVRQRESWESIILDPHSRTTESLADLPRMLDEPDKRKPKQITDGNTIIDIESSTEDEDDDIFGDVEEDED